MACSGCRAKFPVCLAHVGDVRTGCSIAMVAPYLCSGLPWVGQTVWSRAKGGRETPKSPIHPSLVAPCCSHHVVAPCMAADEMHPNVQQQQTGEVGGRRRRCLDTFFPSASPLERKDAEMAERRPPQGVPMGARVEHADGLLMGRRVNKTKRRLASLYLSLSPPQKKKWRAAMRWQQKLRRSSCTGSCGYYYYY